MPHTDRSRPGQWAMVLTAAGFLAFAACQEPAGPPPTLAPGVITLSFSGRLNGSITADGRCYWADGYPAADSACSLALDLGDTVRLRGVRAPRTIRWAHVNVEFPESGACADPDACRIAFDFLSAAGKVEQSFRSTDATVTILEQTEARMRGTFSGRAYVPDGNPGDTIRIFDGAFDVPVER